MATYDPEVLELQKMLKDAGIDPGPLDGIWGPQTAAAKAKYDALPDYAKEVNAMIKQKTRFDPETLETQKMLKAAGLDPGPLDGIWGPKTQAAYDKYNSMPDYAKEVNAMIKQNAAQQAQAKQAPVLLSGAKPVETKPTDTGASVLMDEPDKIEEKPADIGSGTTGGTVLSPDNSASAQPEKTTQDFINELFSEDEMGYDENFEQISSEEMLNEIF